MPPITAVSHPSWCSPEYCDTSAGHARHRSAPIMWRTTSDAELALSRVAFDAGGDEFYELRVRDLAWSDEISVLLQDEDASMWQAAIQRLRFMG